jgi:hypothetical protein
MDQEGANSKTSYHLYANLIDTCLSIVLALLNNVKCVHEQMEELIRMCNIG